MDYEFPLGLTALVGIIPLIIVYLLKPRPKQIILPTLMFVQKISQNVLSSRRKITKKITDPLFFLQLLTLILLSIAIAGPLLDSVSKDSEKVVIIIDSSASMSIPDRISAARAIAIESLGEENTIIAAESIPVVLAKAVDRESAKALIDSLDARNTPADVPESILNVVNEKENENARIIVISDFENWAGRTPETYIRIANAKNMQLELKQVGRPTVNCAIINGYLKDRNDGTYDYTCTVKNFGNESVKLDVQLESKSGLFSPQKVNNSIALDGFGAQEITFSSIPQGASAVRIMNKDAVSCDNTAYISISEVKPKKMLVLTDLDPISSKSPLITALSLIPDIKIDVENRLPDNFKEYDAIVINCQKEALSSSTVRKIVSYARNGKDLIVIGNGCLYNSTDMHELYPVLPVDLVSIEENENNIIETTGSGYYVFNDVSFEEVYLHKYLAAVPKDNVSVLVELKGAGPVVCAWNIKNGTTMYVGLSDTIESEAWTNFPTVPTYPVFWVKLLKYMWGIDDITETNVNTGRYQAFDQNTIIRTPTETMSSKFIYYDECGIYHLNQKTVAANLYDSAESNTFTEKRLSLESENADFKKEDLQSRSPDKIRKYLIYSLLFLLVIENVIMLRRKIL